MSAVLRIGPVAFALGFALAGCSGDSEPPQRSVEEMAAREQVAAEPCQLLDAKTASSVLGVDMQAETIYPDVCLYSPLEGKTPVAELRYGPGQGAVAMMAAGVIHADGSSGDTPSLGIGEQSALLGDEWAIRHGEDLLTLRIQGVEDAERAVRRLYAEIREKL